MKSDSATYQEIFSQPAIWNSTLKDLESISDKILQFWKSGPFDNLLLTGCGSTYYLAKSASAHVQEQLRIRTRGIPASELLLHPEIYYLPQNPSLLIAFSRSGETTETIQAVQQHKDLFKDRVVVITNNPASLLASLGDLTISLPLGQEDSVVQTRAFTSMHLAHSFLTALWSGNADIRLSLHALGRIGQEMIDKYTSDLAAIGTAISMDRFYFLGSGSLYGIACEASLKMKEMTLTHSEPFHFFEFRHGPMSMAGPGSVIIGLISDRNRNKEAQVLVEMKELGAVTIAIAEDSDGITVDQIFSLSSRLSEQVRDILYLLPIHIMTIYRALEKGLDPDHPHNLTAVVKLKP